MISICDCAELELIRLFIDDDDLASDVWVIVFLTFRDRPYCYNARLVILQDLIVMLELVVLDNIRPYNSKSADEGFPP